MEQYVKKLRIGNIRLAVESELAFDLSGQSRPFEAEFDVADVTFRMGTEQRFSPEKFRTVHRFGLTDLRVREQEFLKVQFSDRRRQKIDWYSWCSRENPGVYQVFIGEDWRSRLNAINPLYFCDLSCFLMDYGAVAIHSSLIETRYGGIVFTAPSGTGKSTQAELWAEHRDAQIINGDRSVIRKEDAFRAYGSPYAGSSRIYKNQSAALRAIVVLRQAPYNRIRLLRGREAYLCLASEISISAWNEEIVGKQMDFIMDLIRNVPVYMLECLPDEGAVETLERVLRGETDGRN